jgi:hypothetical protein
MQQRGDGANAREPASDFSEPSGYLDHKHNRREHDGDQTLKEEFPARGRGYVRGLQKFQIVRGKSIRECVGEFELLVRSQTLVGCERYLNVVPVGRKVAARRHVDAHTAQGFPRRFGKFIRVNVAVVDIGYQRASSELNIQINAENKRGQYRRRHKRDGERYEKTPFLYKFELEFPVEHFYSIPFTRMF